MRIHRIHLQHVAGVDDHELLFDDGVTVVVGPNEAGKSTIPTALRLLLEEKDRYDNADIRAVRPVHTDADPTIELECTTGPYRLTYRKVFGRTAGRRETSLVVHAPTAASLTGDQAHDRMLAILDETVDEALWAALRVQQRHDVGQADLGGAGTLMAALDAAGGGADASAEDDTLITRVEEEAARYWTSTGRRRRPLEDVDRAVDEAAAALAAARDELAALSEATEHHDRLVARVATCREELPTLQRRAKETAEALGALTTRRAAVADAARRVEQADASVVASRDALSDRRSLVGRLSRLTGLLDEHERAADSAARRVTSADEAAADARSDRDALRAELDAQRGALRRAEADRDLVRLDHDAAALRERITQATTLQQQREDARARLDDGAPSAAAIRQIERLEGEVRTAAALRDAGVPRVRVAGPDGAGVTVDSDTLALGGDGVELPITSATTIAIGEVTLTITPGASVAELADRLGDAEHALRGALDDAGVVDLADARARREAAQDARRELDATQEVWARVTAAEGVDGLRAALRRTEGQLDELRAARPADRALPADRAAAESIVDGRRRDVEHAEAALATADAALEAATATAAVARTASAESLATLAGTRDRLTELGDELARGRAIVDDDALASAVEDAEQRLADAREVHARAVDSLAALDADTLERDAAAAVTRLEATRREADEADLERAQVWGRIEASAAAGLGERLPELEAAHAAAVQERAATHRTADALLLLRDTLRARRDDSRARYVGPLRERIEALGRAVFGSSFGVELDEQLRVTRRTLDGRTLDLDQLSGGAQEQLAIISRLAAASLVDPEDGVPVILDDALGYADPTRTDRVSSLLGDVARRTQVIVLTCDPDRFAAIPDARVVRLP